jgi:hypothetical protein
MDLPYFLRYTSRTQRARKQAKGRNTGMPNVSRQPPEHACVNFVRLDRTALIIDPDEQRSQASCAATAPAFARSIATPFIDCAVHYAQLRLAAISIDAVREFGVA